MLEEEFVDFAFAYLPGGMVCFLRTLKVREFQMRTESNLDPKQHPPILRSVDPAWTANGAMGHRQAASREESRSN